MSTHDTRTALDRLIEVHGLAHAGRALHQLSRPSIHLLPHAVAEDAAPRGASRLGGRPDLPAGAAWPSWRGRPLAFVAQLRLSELGPHDPGHLLPGRGLLHFFYDLEDQPDGQVPEDRGGLRVLFHPDERAALTRTDSPSRKAPVQLTAARVELVAEPSMPPEESHEAQVLDLSAEDWDLYYQLLQSLETPTGREEIPRHKLLGYADPLQGDMRLDCQLVTHGMRLTDEAAFRDPRVAALDPGISEWQLLLQLDHDPAHGLELTGGGRLYVMLRLAHLRAGRFDDAWAILQLPA